MKSAFLYVPRRPTHGIYFGVRERATALLGGLKDWMAANNAVIMAVLCLVIAARLIGDGISGLAG